MRNMQLKGSMTVYATLSLMIVASLILAFLENGRIEGLRAYVKMDGVSSTSSLLSMYNNMLFERYGILMLDTGFGGDTPDISKMERIIQEYSQNNLKPVHDKRFLIFDTVNFFQMDCKSVDVMGYQLATDDGGDAFRSLCAQSMKYEFAMDVLTDLSEEMEESAEQALRASTSVQAASDNSRLAIEDAKQAKIEEDAKKALNIKPEDEIGLSDVIDESALLEGQVADGPMFYFDEFGMLRPISEKPAPKNPADTVDDLKKMDTLDLLLPGNKKVSTKKIDSRKSITKRKLNEGNYRAETEEPFAERVLFNEFINVNFTHYEPLESGTNKEGALDYEIEYLISGKNSDRDNLKTVAGDILAMREGMNFLYLLSDVEKTSEARALAVSILAAYPVAEVAEELVTMGILAAWAFGESVLDVRTLLAGGKVQWFKTYECWTLGLENIGSLSTNDIKAKEPAVGGADYNDYLKKLLYTKLDKTLNYRVMDLMEMNLNKTEAYKNCKMDCMLLAFSVELSYEAESLFPKFVTVTDNKLGNYGFTRTVEDGYLQKKSG